jgi:ribosomal protein L16/L10AE
VANVPLDQAQAALRLGAAKLGIKTRMVPRVEQV